MLLRKNSPYITLCEGVQPQLGFKRANKTSEDQGDCIQIALYCSGHLYLYLEVFLLGLQEELHY